MALVLTWKGVWRGGWCNLERIRDYVSSQRDLSQHEFAVLKWLRVPVLHPILETMFGQAVANDPIQFVQSWRSDDGLPTDIRPHDNIIGCDSVIRHFLWTRNLGVYWSGVASVVGRCNYLCDKDRCCQHLEKLLDVCSRLFWRGIVECYLRCPKDCRSLYKAFLNSRVGLAENARGSAVAYRLQNLRRRVVQATGLPDERLDALVSKICPSKVLRSKEDAAIISKDEDVADLLALGGTYNGREYLAVRMIQHWKDQI